MLFLCRLLCLLCKVILFFPHKMWSEWLCKLHSGCRPSTSPSLRHLQCSHSSLLPFVLAQSLCFGLLFPFTSALSGYSNRVSVQTQLASWLHMGAPALGLQRKQRLISGQARYVHPVWLLSLHRTSKLCGFVGQISGWIEVRDGACVRRCWQVFAIFLRNVNDPLL